ncbi:MAG TPA: glycosyltransferase [Solirubrobacteraceae bacterium]|nr:glycosyltransferase [Solirubrobacteraceae bacterium]
MPPSLPTVSVLMGLYNYEQYVGRALESALAQDYPSELVEIIVVDDGSTDGSAAVVREIAARHPGRVKLVQQDNGGYIAATNRAMAEATGELLALLDADDVWLPHKLTRQVRELRERPRLALVFSDMVVVDSSELVVAPSLVGALGELPGDAFARVLYANVATQASIVIRASLRELVHPIPEGIPYADWWLALRAAQVGEIDYVREPLALYRQHGANLTGGATGAAGVREHRKEVSFQLWCLRHLELDRLAPEAIAFVWSGVEEHARMALQAGGSYFVQPAEVDPDGPAHADALLARAEQLAAAGDLHGEALATLRALAWDPFRVGLRERLSGAVERAQAAAARPHPLEGARGFVVIVDAEELLAGDEAMLAYAQAMRGSELITLAIDATRLEPEAAARELHGLVERCELGGREDIDLLAVVGPCDAAQRHRMEAGVHARYTTQEGGEGERREGERDRPTFTPDTLQSLRAYAQSAVLLGPEAARRSVAQEALLGPLLA